MNRSFLSRTALIVAIIGLLSFAKVGPVSAGVLSGTLSAPAGAVNLTTQGTADWAYWEGTSVVKFDQHNAPTVSIGALSLLGAPPALFDYGGGVGGVTYSWTNGTNTLSSGGDGVLQAFPSTTGDGFRLTFPAATTVRRARFYGGGSTTIGQISASLSDASAPVDVHTLGFGGATASVYDVFYRADSPGQTLTVDWTRTEAGGSNILVAGATLEDLPSGLRNPSFESPGGGGFPQADEWGALSGNAPTALHSAFPYGNNGSLGSSFVFVFPNSNASQILGDVFEANTTYTFDGFGVDNNINNENDLAFRIGYIDGSGVFQELDSDVYDLTGLTDWSALDGVSYTTGATGPEIGELVVLRLGGVLVDNGSGGVFADGLAFSATSALTATAPEPATCVLAAIGLFGLMFRRRRR